MATHSSSPFFQVADEKYEIASIDSFNVSGKQPKDMDEYSL
jgi:hypothetical protein